MASGDSIEALRVDCCGNSFPTGVTSISVVLTFCDCCSLVSSTSADAVEGGVGILVRISSSGSSCSTRILFGDCVVVVASSAFRFPIVGVLFLEMTSADTSSLSSGARSSFSSSRRPREGSCSFNVCTRASSIACVTSALAFLSLTALRYAGMTLDLSMGISKSRSSRRPSISDCGKRPCGMIPSLIRCSLLSSAGSFDGLLRGFLAFSATCGRPRCSRSWFSIFWPRRPRGGKPAAIRSSFVISGPLLREGFEFETGFSSSIESGIDIESPVCSRCFRIWSSTNLLRRPFGFRPSAILCSIVRSPESCFRFGKPIILCVDTGVPCSLSEVTSKPVSC